MDEQELGIDPVCEDGGDPEVKYFRYLEEKKFNIVIDKKIQYKVKNTGQENQNWTWSVIDKSATQHKEYTLSTSDGSPMSNIGHSSTGNNTPNLFITKDQLPENNNKFGEQEVTAQHLPSSSPAVTKMSNDKVVRSFFIKNKMSVHNPTEPNWFYYWKQTQPILDLISSLGTVKIYDVDNGCIQKEISVDVSIIYDPTYNYSPPSISATTANNIDFSLIEVSGTQLTSQLTSEGTYGATVWPLPTRANASTFSSCDGNPEVLDKTIITGYAPIVIKIGKGAGMKKPGALEGYNAFYETIAHEISHAKFDIENYGNDGSVIDTDYDGYDDRWEASFADNYQSYSALGIDFTVSVAHGEDDEYLDDYDDLKCLLISLDGTVAINPNPIGRCNAGTLFGELFVRTQAKQLLDIAKPNLASYDWSYDDGVFKYTTEYGKERSLITVNANW